MLCKNCNETIMRRVKSYGNAGRVVFGKSVKLRHRFEIAEFYHLNPESKCVFAEPIETKIKKFGWINEV